MEVPSIASHTAALQAIVILFSFVVFKSNAKGTIVKANNIVPPEMK
jgi:hypothetical protein